MHEKVLMDEMICLSTMCFKIIPKTVCAGVTGRLIEQDQQNTDIETG